MVELSAKRQRENDGCPHPTRQTTITVVLPAGLISAILLGQTLPVGTLAPKYDPPLGPGTLGDGERRRGGWVGTPGHGGRRRGAGCAAGAGGGEKN